MPNIEKRIRKADVKDLVPLVVEAWIAPYGSVSTVLSKAERKVVGKKGKYVRLATGGWSGNEEIIAAFFRNPLHGLVFCMMASGGLYILREWEDGQ